MKSHTNSHLHQLAICVYLCILLIAVSACVEGGAERDVSFSKEAPLRIHQTGVPDPNPYVHNDLRHVEEMASDATSDEPISSPRGFHIVNFTYKRQFEDCFVQKCITELEFGVRGGVVWHVQHGVFTRSATLTSAEYRYLQKAVTRQEFLHAMDVGFSCPTGKSNTSFVVTFGLETKEDGESARMISDVSGCYYDNGEIMAEELIDFSERIFHKYYE